MTQPSSSIASRVIRRMRRRRVVRFAAALFASHHYHATSAAANGIDQQIVSTPATTRRNAPISSTRDFSRHPTLVLASSINPERQQYIATIKSKLGHYKHHGTGNPLAARSPDTSKTLAVDNLALIILSGFIGQKLSDTSIPNLRTAMGSSCNNGSFWVNSVELAGRYGWTGLILPPNADTSRTFPISDVVWFVLENEEERSRLKSLLNDNAKNESERNTLTCTKENTWKKVKDRVVTLSKLAEIL